jgi:hypothetical protein
MEQAVSFVLVVLMCAVGIVLHWPVWILSSFLIGCTYLLLRGRAKGWRWRR